MARRTIADGEWIGVQTEITLDPTMFDGLVLKSPGVVIPVCCDDLFVCVVLEEDSLPIHVWMSIECFI